MIGGLFPVDSPLTVIVPITSSYIGPGKIAFTGTPMEKQASGHPTVLKRQDLRGLLKSDLRGETQSCAN
jgi:hypothetical protein